MAQKHRWEQLALGSHECRKCGMLLTHPKGKATYVIDGKTFDKKTVPKCDNRLEKDTNISTLVL